MQTTLEARFSDLELFTMFNVELPNGQDMWEFTKRNPARRNSNTISRENALREAETRRVCKHRAEVYRMALEIQGEPNDE